MSDLPSVVFQLGKPLVRMQKQAFFDVKRGFSGRVRNGLSYACLIEIGPGCALSLGFRTFFLKFFLTSSRSFSYFSIASTEGLSKRITYPRLLGKRLMRIQVQI